MSHKQTSTRHHSERSFSGGLCPGLPCNYPRECLAMCCLSFVSENIMSEGVSWGSGQGRCGVHCQSHPSYRAGRQLFKGKSSSLTEARDHLLDSLAKHCASQQSTHQPSLLHHEIRGLLEFTPVFHFNFSFSYIDFIRNT